MKITAVTPMPLRMVTDYSSMTWFMVKIETDEGVIGWGESCDCFGISYPTVLATIVDDVWAPALIGRSIDEALGALDAKRVAVRRTLGEQSAPAQSRSAVEIALRDLIGKAAGASVSATIGRVSERVEVYAGNSHFLESRSAAEHLELLAPMLDRGVRMVKMRIGVQWREAMQVLTDLRALTPAIDLMVDGSELFTVAESIEMSERLADLRVAWFEEPVPATRLTAIGRIATASRVPIAYGEHLYSTEHALDTLDEAPISVIQPDASICGGIGEAQLMARSALGRGARVVMHLHGGPVTIAANALVAASVAGVDVIEYPFHLSPALRRVSPGAGFDIESIVDGTIAVPTGPGLGIDVDDDAIEAGRVAYLDA